MNRFQNISFHSVEAFLDYLPEEELSIVQWMRQQIADIFPRFEEKLAYNVPFYWNCKRICCIWPAAVPWGNLSHGVALGFVHGHILDPQKELLGFETRKTMGRMIFPNMEALMEQEHIVRHFLQEAYFLDASYS